MESCICNIAHERYYLYRSLWGREKDGMSSELGGTEEKQAVQFTEQAVATPAPENIAAILGHIKRYLQEMKRDYAIAISGGWGCGKTHFIRNELVNENIPLPDDSKSNYRFVYLSLFGMKYDEAIKALAVKLSYRSRWYVSLFANIARSLRFCTKSAVWCVLAVLLFLILAVCCWGWWGLSLLIFPVALWLFDRLSSCICSGCQKAVTLNF